MRILCERRLPTFILVQLRIADLDSAILVTHAPWAVYGLPLIVCMYVAPSGMAGLARRTLAFIRKAGRAWPLT